MRIDDENKIVWCNEEEIAWYKTYDTWNGDKKGIIVHHLSRMGFGYGLTNAYDGDTGKFWYELDVIQNRLIKAVIDDYEFKLEQPQKYYWRKKKEHLAWFEEEIYLTRFKFSDNENFVYILGSKVGSLQMTEPEAFHLLQDDFDKFEKVECE